MAKKKAVEKQKEVVSLEVKHTFSKDELDSLAAEVVEANLDAEDLEAERKSVAAGYKDRLEAANLKARTAGRKYRDGYEMRQTECELVRDYESELIIYYNLETGEEVQARPMTRQEKQLCLEDAL